MAYGTIIKGRKGFSNGSSICNRKKQSHQQVINSLKPLSFKIAPSGLDMPEDPLARAVVGEAPSDSETAKKDFNCHPNNGVSGYNEQECNIPTCERSERAKKKSSLETKPSKHRSEDLASDSSLQCSQLTVNGPSESPAEKELICTKGMKEMWILAPLDHRQGHTLHHNMEHEEILTSHNIYTKERSKPMEQPMVNMSLVHGLEMELAKESSRLDLFGGTQNGGLSVTSQNIRSTHQQHAHQQSSSYLHHLSGAQKHQVHPQQPMQQELHHAMPKANGSHQYSFDFLVDVGLKMSYAGTGNGTSQSVGPMPCAASQMNYNFTQQFQQHLQHHQHLPQHAPHDHSQSTSPSRSQSHPVMHHHHQQHHAQHMPQAMSQQQQNQHHRSQPTVYGGENLISQQNFVMNDAPAFSNHIAIASTRELQMLNACTGANSNSGNMVEAAPYVYTQHEGDQQHQHHPGMYYQQHHSQQQQQPHQQYLHNYHTNNNYQYHNRNGRGIPANYYGHGGAGSGRDEGSRKKPWAGHTGAKGKGSAPPSTGKQFNKVQNVGYSYRKNYHHYHNYPAGNGHQYYEHSSVPPPHHHHKQNMYRNLVYVRGYDQGHGAAYLPETSAAVSTTHCAKEPVETAEQHSADNCLNTTIAAEEEVPAPNELVVENEARDAEDGCEKLCSVPRSSSSSSVVSIPSTASSAVSCRSAVSQAHLPLEATHANGHGYESDSSHSSDYHDGTYRAYSKYSQNNDERPVYRSSSTTSSGISTYPPSSEFIPSTPLSMQAGTLVSEFFGRSHSYHGSHQNLSVYASGGSVGEVSPPAGSPTGNPRSVSGTQSLPLFGELFGTANHHQLQLTDSQSVISFGSSSSLDQAALHNVACSSSSSSSLSASSVPPNDFSSMQSGHPKKRSHSGRASPNNGSAPTRAPSRCAVASASSGGSSAASKEHATSSSAGRKNNQVSLSYTYHTSLPPDFSHTPADRFILRANEVEMKSPPEPLTDGGPHDGLSLSIWEKFTAAQQTEETYIAKMHLWRYLYTCIRKAYPKYGLYLVGSTISGFGANSSDVDMCLVARGAPIYFDPRTEALCHLSLVKDYFVNLPSPTFEQFSLIQAKVPILRFQDSKNGIEVDLNFNNCVGIRNTHLLHCYSQMDWRVRPLVLVVKLWAHHHNINDAKSMTISSYSLVLMVIHFLQCGVSVPVLPCLHSMYPDKFMKIIDINSIEMIERIEPYKTENRQTLGELLLQFLEYYTHFEYARYAISVRTASIIPIEECRLARSYKNDPHHWKHLCIEEPFDLTNTARSVFDGDVFEQIKSTFATSWRMLKASKRLSVLFGDPLFTPLTSTLSITS
ncbi:poly(A) RNA polymerase gld-2 homolog B [Anopheles bellator]|uniref:poly(A) RNA polymerase gld-2 homolog B n=1 Tax=Anopheles bellator TaxID=139047 RepID=UPI0026499661|nr:poly(A) RNA polymerase gld-2 homolog B [Anopheles bellator]